MSSDSAFYQTLSLAMRAGQLDTGEPGVRALVSSGQACLVLLDQGISEASLKRFQDHCRFYSVPLAVLEEGRLGQSIGKPNRMCCAVRKGNLGNQLLRKAAGLIQNESNEPMKKEIIM